MVMPGIIDPHVHICEPGHLACEGFASATKAAAAGGITTIVDMPLYGTRRLGVGSNMAVPGSGALQTGANVNPVQST